jgi:hypothetical protein
MITCQCWVNDSRNVLGTEEGKVIVMDGKNVVATIALDNTSPVVSIVVWNSHLLVSTIDTVYILTTSLRGMPYEVTSGVKSTDEKMKFRSLIISPSESMILCISSDSILYEFMSEDVKKEVCISIALIFIGRTKD